MTFTTTVFITASPSFRYLEPDGGGLGISTYKTLEVIREYKNVELSMDLRSINVHNMYWTLACRGKLSYQHMLWTFWDTKFRDKTPVASS